MKELFKILIEISEIIKNMLPFDLNKMAIYLLLFKFFKFSRLIVIREDEESERKSSINNSIIAILAVIISILYIVGLYKEANLNPMYIAGFIIAQEDFGFKIKIKNYGYIKIILLIIAVISILVKISLLIK